MPALEALLNTWKLMRKTRREERESIAVMLKDESKKVDQTQNFACQEFRDGYWAALTNMEHRIRTLKDELECKDAPDCCKKAP